MVGQTISHYRILDKLGEGGMGVVYRAEDTKLDRPVALKFLPAHLLGSDDVRKRFEREAKSSAALSHPNVCTVHEIDQADDQTFIAMELIEGGSLDKKIARGPLKLAEALSIAQQVAKGLEAAHKRGIVHRDIKPENIMVGDDGHVTIMDFGLAQLAEASRLTKTDETVGTVAYMSPEQTEGSGTDHRTDIWSLGVVLYEMVTGQQPFKGDYDKAVMYSILNEEPEPITALRTGLPMELEVFVGKCLAKEPANRYSSSAELANDLRTLGERLKTGHSAILSRSSLAVGQSAQRPGGAAVPGSSAVIPRARQLTLYGLSALLGIALLCVLAVHLSEAPPRKRMKRFSFTHKGVGRVSISPDGQNVVFSAIDEEHGHRLWLRALSSESPRPISGTENASYWVDAWSPDSQSIVFATDSQLKRVDITSGDPIVICDLPVDGENGFPYLGATWSKDADLVVFSSGLDLWTVPAKGGEPKLAVEREPGNFYWSPRFLPNGESMQLVYTAASEGLRRIEIFDMETGERGEVGRGSVPIYAPSGYLLIGPDSNEEELGIWAMPFSAIDGAPTGGPVPLSGTGSSASVSLDGTLVYKDGPQDGAESVVVTDRSGNVLRTIRESIGHAEGLAVSPDGRRVAIGDNGDVWVYDLDRDLGVRLIEGPAAGGGEPAWRDAGDEVSYRASATKLIMVQAADGSAPARVVSAPDNARTVSWSRGGRYAAFAGTGPDGERGIFYAETNPSAESMSPTPYLHTSAIENQPQISPDGRYLAYRSTESGQPEVYVRPFPTGSGKVRVSTSGGSQPRWSADGSELFYVSGSSLMSVSASTAEDYQPGVPERLFDMNGLSAGGRVFNYDVFPDGRRFVMFHIDKDILMRPDTIRFVENWYEEFRDREQD